MPLDTHPLIAATLLAEAPKWTDQAQAWGTVLGALFSGLALVATFTLLWQNKRDRKDEEGAQARLVSAQARPAAQIGAEPVTIVYDIYNHSASPIFDVQLELRGTIPGIGTASSADDPRGGLYRNIVQPWEQLTGKRWQADRGTAHRVWTLAAEQPDKEKKIYPDVVPVLSFTDVRGLRWQRKGSEPAGRLLEDRSPSRFSLLVRRSRPNGE